VNLPLYSDMSDKNSIVKKALSSLYYFNVDSLETLNLRSIINS